MEPFQLDINHLQQLDTRDLAERSRLALEGREPRGAERPDSADLGVPTKGEAQAPQRAAAQVLRAGPLL